MYRATTPMLKFELPLETNTIAVGYITIAQSGKTIVEKPLSSWTLQGKSVKVVLTQEETMKLVPGINVEIQMRIRLADGTALASKIFSLTAERVLKDGEI